MLTSQARVNATCRPIKTLWRLAVGASTAKSLTFKSGSRCPPTHNSAFGLPPPSGTILRFTCFLSRYKNLAGKILNTSAFYRTVSLSLSDKGLTVPKKVLFIAFPMLKRRGAAYSRHHCLLPTASLVVILTMKLRFPE